MKKILMRSFLFFLLVFSTSCQHYAEHKANLRFKKTLLNMTSRLKKIETKEDLILQSNSLKKDIEQLAIDLIQIKQKALTNQDFQPLKRDHVQKNFEAELERILSMSGCYEILCNLSIDGLYLIDAFERKLENPKLRNIKSKMVLEN